ncbi:phage baseplate assembly protein V [Paraburkholderia bryophila]|uniref:Uncharacterized protein involved in type VI secretion and phage assembly n=1 Tax=Paraburkholderia bryophila TaxID=420952 RepID=A0A7Z0B556_9BURK|nr:phage baseplate assembly protein V [Paraburkholderia bryophila]NYH21619.1 uncharacterized protein involved in type VI secretion and phage assembly [Paraburkholderia bryophila]
MHFQSPIVVGPANADVYTNPLNPMNRIKVRFHRHRLNNDNEKASCRARAAMSDASGGYVGVHVSTVGEEVLINWVNGDCDRPFVTGCVYNGAANPHWHSKGL